MESISVRVRNDAAAPANEVLLPHRQLPAEAVVVGMTTLLKVGAISTDLVAIEARKAPHKNPHVPPETIGELKNPVWVQEGLPLVMIGDSDTGKSHLLIGIGTAIAEAGLRSATPPPWPW